MSEKNVAIELSYAELEVLKEIMEESVAVLQKGLREVEAGKLSIGECGEFDYDADADFHLDLQAKVEQKLTNIQHELDRNDVKFIQQDHVFRIEERVKVYQVSNRQFDQLAFVHETRHGVHLLYIDIEALIKSYTDGEESKLRFECEKEAEFYLLYWKGENQR
jgi:hypothetical protein